MFIEMSRHNQPKVGTSKLLLITHASEFHVEAFHNQVIFCATGHAVTLGWWDLFINFG